MSQASFSDTALSEKLELDAQLAQPLERVNYAAGMMLSLEAINAEQRYHRQRVNRLQYWFQGAGTLLGLAVKQVSAVEVEEGKDQSLRLVVSPGIAIDGLGRELLCHEPYCVNLRDWLAAQQKSDSAFLTNAKKVGEEAIQLSVTIRYQSASSGLQPVMARTINSGIDPVQPSRAKDALLLEILPGALPVASAAFTRAGLAQNAVNTAALDGPLTTSERDYLAGLTDVQAQQLAQLQAQQLYGPRSDVGALELQGQYEELARVLLAVIELPLRPPKPEQPLISPILHPKAIRINNLIRPFITTPDQLRWLYLQEIAS